MKTLCLRFPFFIFISQVAITLLLFLVFDARMYYIKMLWPEVCISRHFSFFFFFFTFLLTLHFVREFTPELSIEAKKAEKKAGKKKKRNQSAQSEAPRSGAGIMLFSRGVHILFRGKHVSVIHSGRAQLPWPTEVIFSRLSPRKTAIALETPTALCSRVFYYVLACLAFPHASRIGIIQDGLLAFTNNQG